MKNPKGIRETELMRDRKDMKGNGRLLTAFLASLSGVLDDGLGAEEVLEVRLAVQDALVALVGLQPAAGGMGNIGT